MVTNLINSNGNATANQFVITDGNKVIFQSYASKVCEIKDDEATVVFGINYNYSKTTSKHLYEFLKQNGLYSLANKTAIQKAIKNGEHNGVKVIYDEEMC